MSFFITGGWALFCIMFGVTLVTSFIMNRQSRNFYTQDVVLRKFNIMDLQLPASALEIVNLVKGIYALPGEQSQKTLKSLKGQLYIDFIFMPAAYGTIFLICMQVSSKMTAAGHWIFAGLAWLQIVSWLCDIIENIYLLKKIRKDVTPSTPGIQKAYLRLEILKWGVALTGAVCSLFALFYFWLIGYYSKDSLKYLLIVIGEIALFFIAGKMTKKGNLELGIGN